MHLQEKMLSYIVQTIQERLMFLLLNPLSLLPLLLLMFSIYKWISPISTHKKNLPPSPPRLPIIGNLHQLGLLPYRSLQTLSEKYGDLMLLYLGNKPTVVISSAEVAYEILKTHDRIFASRPYLTILRKLLENGNDMVSAPYGERWKHMRSICMVHLFSNKRVKSFRKVGEEEVALMISNIQGLTRVNLNLSDMFMSLSNDLTCRLAFGKKYRGEEGEIDFTKLLGEFLKLFGGLHIGNFISWLGWINKVNGVDAKVNYVASTFDQFLEKILDDHSNHDMKINGDGGQDEEIIKDFVHVLLEAQSDETQLDRESIKGLILDIFSGGTESTAFVLEWMMSALLRNPRVMKELQKEVSRVAGAKDRVNEDEVENMKYLKAVMKETLRLYSPAPLLFPHESTEDDTINGYNIPAGTLVLVNAWAISRNPKYWEQPQSFYPERFLNFERDLKGQHFQFIPFGSGRRMCPASSYATSTIELALANLVLRFNWSLPDGANAETLDMTESPGVVMHRKVPLLVVPSPRLP